MMTEFEKVRNGIHDTLVRKSDGKGLAEVHADGECLRDCPLCALGSIAGRQTGSTKLLWANMQSGRHTTWKETKAGQQRTAARRAL